MKNKKDIEFYKLRFKEVITFITLKNIVNFIEKDNIKSLSDYKNAANSRKAYYLHIDNKNIEKLARIGNKRYFNEFTAEFNDLFIYHKHFHKKYSSGKKFTRNSWFELLDDNLIKLAFDNRKDINIENKDLLSLDESCKFIEKYFKKDIANDDIPEYDNFNDEIKEIFMTNKEFANYGKPKKIKQAKKSLKNKPVQHTIIKDEAYKKLWKEMKEMEWEMAILRDEIK